MNTLAAVDQGDLPCAFKQDENGCDHPRAVELLGTHQDRNQKKLIGECIRICFKITDALSVIKGDDAMIDHCTGEAGSIWRTEKLATFQELAAQIGLEQNEEYQCLIKSIVTDTTSLEELWQGQKVCLLLSCSCCRHLSLPISQGMTDQML